MFVLLISLVQVSHGLKLCYNGLNRTTNTKGHYGSLVFVLSALVVYLTKESASKAFQAENGAFKKHRVLHVTSKLET